MSFKDPIQNTLFSRTEGVIPPTDLKHLALITILRLYSYERTYLWGRAPRPPVPHDEQKCRRDDGNERNDGWRDIPGVQRAFSDGIPVGQPRQESLNRVRSVG